MYDTPEKHKKAVRPTVSLKKVGLFPKAIILNDYPELNKFIFEHFFIESAENFYSNLRLDYDSGPVAFLLRNGKYTPYFKPVGENIYFSYYSQINNLCLITEDSFVALNHYLKQSAKKYFVHTGFNHHSFKPTFEIRYQVPSLVEENSDITYIPSKTTLEKKSDIYIDDVQLDFTKNLFGGNFNTHVKQVNDVKIVGFDKKVSNHIIFNNARKLVDSDFNNETWIPFYTFLMLHNNKFPDNSILEVGFYTGRLFLRLEGTDLVIGKVRLVFRESNIKLSEQLSTEYLTRNDLVKNHIKTLSLPKKIKVTPIKNMYYSYLKSIFPENKSVWNYSINTPNGFPTIYYEINSLNQLSSEIPDTINHDLIAINLNKFKEFSDSYKDQIHYVKYHYFDDSNVYISLHSKTLLEDVLNITINFS